MTGRVVVAGASGLVGRAAVRRFAAEPGWEVVGLSRRVPTDLDAAGATFVSVDLADAGATAEALAGLGPVTHLVYAAVHELPGLAPGWFDEDAIERNARMLRHVLDPLCEAPGGLRHVSLLQGTKAYGVHLPDRPTPPPVPLRERDTVTDQRNFYVEQEAHLRRRREGASWGATVWRPTVVWGDAPGSNMNPLLPLAVHAALLRADGRPLDFPGAALGRAPKEAVAADLVADALVWAATSPAARDRTFNLTNGDVFAWPDLWPALAGAMGMAPGGHRPLALAEEIPRRAADWAELVRTHGLAADPDPVRFVGANSLAYVDQLLRGTAPGAPTVLNSTIAVRRAGFGGCLDTEAMVVDLVDRLHRHRVLPPRPTGP